MEYPCNKNLIRDHIYLVRDLKAFWPILRRRDAKSHSSLAACGHTRAMVKRHRRVGGGDWHIAYRYQLIAYSYSSPWHFIIHMIVHDFQVINRTVQSFRLFHQYILVIVVFIITHDTFFQQLGQFSKGTFTTTQHDKVSVCTPHVMVDKIIAAIQTAIDVIHQLLRAFRVIAVNGN